MGAVLEPAAHGVDMVTKPRISVVVPCHNERATLEQLVAEVRDALDPLGVTYDLTLVDDGSTDDSWDVMTSLASTDTRVRARRLASRCGQSAAIWAGLDGVCGDVVITIDADLQNPPDNFPRLLAALDQHECVVGTRADTRRRGDTRWRIVAARIANSVRRGILRDRFGDAGCGFRAFRRECVERLPRFSGMHRFVPTLLAMEGFRVAEVAVDHRPRRAGRSHYGVWNRLFVTLEDLFGVWWLKRRRIQYRIAERIN